MFLIVKILLPLTLSLTLPFVLSASAADKTQYFVHLGFNSTLQLIHSISRDLQKLLKYFNGTGIVAFLKIIFAASATVFSNNLALYLKDLKLSSLAMSALKSVASSLE